MAKLEKSYWEKLAKDSGLDDAATKAMLTAVENEAFEKGLYATLVPRSDADRAITEAKKASDEAAAKATKLYQDNLKWYADKQRELALLDRYKSEIGDLDGNTTQDRSRDTNTNPNAVPNGNGNGNGQYVTPDVLQQMQRNQYMLNKQIRRAATEFERTFGEVFPEDEVEALALRPENAGRDYTSIYRDWVAPKLEDKRAKEQEEAVKKAREEGEKAGLAKGRMREPTALAPDEIPPLYATRDANAAKLDDVTLQQHFVETFDAAGAKT